MCRADSFSVPNASEGRHLPIFGPRGNWQLGALLDHCFRMSQFESDGRSNSDNAAIRLEVFDCASNLWLPSETREGGVQIVVHNFLKIMLAEAPTVAGDSSQRPISKLASTS